MKEENTQTITDLSDIYNNLTYLFKKYDICEEDMHNFRQLIQNCMSNPKLIEEILSIF